MITGELRNQVDKLWTEFWTGGITVPPSDLILSALALENECMVFTEDAHFDEIPGISLYSPKASKMKSHPEKQE